MYVDKGSRYLLLDMRFIVLTILTLGIVAGVSAAAQKTQVQQEASRFVNLNSADEIDTTFNPDRTMGPKTSKGNFSTTLPNAYLGKTVISLAGTDKFRDDILSIKLSISKAEVHLIHLDIPGTRISSSFERIGGLRTNQDVSKWETLQLNGDTDEPVMMKLEDGFMDSFGYTQLAGGKYSEIRLYISKVTGNLLSGEETELVLPGESSIIRVAQPFKVFSDKTTYLTLGFDFKNSVIKEGDIYFFKPVISGITLNSE